ncbi:MAG: hypothetical protein F6K17_15695 [Okeania sp. SIO3C4]|nr:hypothetical protein [Okeania sp. SIO3C4]
MLTVRHLWTQTSSISSILSKCLFTNGSSTNAHHLSAGCNSGEYGGKCSLIIPNVTLTF